MTIAVNDLLSRAGVLLNDVAERRWPATEKLGWLNDGARALVTFKPDACVKTIDVALVAGAKQALPADAVVVIEMRSATQAPVLPCDKTALDAFAAGWTVKPTASTVKNYMTSPNDPQVFWVYPAQNDTPATLKVTYSAYPVAAVAGGTINVIDGYYDRLLNYILYRAMSKDAEFAGSAEMAASYYKLFVS
jgi:hypothetical protein